MTAHMGGTRDAQRPIATDRASSWFVERQSESTVLLIVDRSDGRPVGLLILSESGNSDRSLDIRLGYMIERTLGAGG
jgi:hypothetical protein